MNDMGQWMLKKWIQVSVLNDMIHVRDGWGSCSILNTEYVNFIINDICTNNFFFICFTTFV